MSAYYELESLPEMEAIYEAEWSGETPGAFESEMFFQELSRAARGGRNVAPLQRLAMAGARAALRQGGAGDIEGYDSLAFLGQSEFEGEFEGEAEGEMEQAVHFMQQFPTTALMEHLGHAAAEAEDEGESFAFLAPLIPMAAKLAAPLLTKGLGLAAKVGGKMAAKALPKLAQAATKTISKAVPQMTKSLQGVAKTLLQNKQTQPLLRTLPQIAQRATADLTRQVARGRPVTRQTAAQAVARQAAKVLGNPRQAVRAWQGSNDLDRKFHRVAGAAMPPPAEVGGTSVSPGQVAAGIAGGAAGGGGITDGGIGAGVGTGGTGISTGVPPYGGQRRRGCCCCRCN
ncbi:MAG TPA: hypothetical protein VF736_21800 [Pyrinomonadaceae bacterium]|jgi:hypothetical protein